LERQRRIRGDGGSKRQQQEGEGGAHADEYAPRITDV
jgi:hypothetical protein